MPTAAVLAARPASSAAAWGGSPPGGGGEEGAACITPAGRGGGRGGSIGDTHLDGWTPEGGRKGEDTRGEWAGTRGGGGRGGGRGGSDKGSSRETAGGVHRGGSMERTTGRGGRGGNGGAGDGSGAAAAGPRRTQPLRGQRAERSRTATAGRWVGEGQGALSKSGSGSRHFSVSRAAQCKFRTVTGRFIIDDQSNVPYRQITIGIPNFTDVGDTSEMTDSANTESLTCPSVG